MPYKTGEGKLSKVIPWILKISVCQAEKGLNIEASS